MSELGSQTNKMPDLSIISSDNDSIEMRKRRKDQLQRDFLPGNYALSMKDQLFQRYNGLGPQFEVMSNSQFSVKQAN